MFLGLLSFLLTSPMALLLEDRLAVVHEGCVALGVRMTNILVLVPTLIGVLCGALLNVLRLALLMVLVRALLRVLSLAPPLMTLLALCGVLGVALVQVLVLAMLLISRGTVWLVMLLPYHVTLLFILEKLLEFLQDSS